MYNIFNSNIIITQYFANDFPDPITGKPYYWSNFGLFGHDGIDVIPHDIKIDKNLYNRHNGIIMFAGFDTGYGNRIKIWIKELGICEYYCHLEKIDNQIKEGLELKERILLGIIGNSGRSMGVHLHYQICKVDDKCNKLNTKQNDKDCIHGYIDPLPFLKN
jgi:murein DD-endopeptidase MepM/ murein hydrolase activator NlpD